MKDILVRNGMYIKVLNRASKVQVTNQRLRKRRFDGCASVESTIVQASNRRLDKRRIDDCTSIEMSNRRSY